MSQKAAVLAAQAIVRAVSGILAAPDYPPEQMGNSYFPFVVAYPGDGTHAFGVPGERLFLGQIVVEVHVARKDLPNAVQGVIEFGDTIPAALMADSTLVGVVDTFGSVDQTFGELNWGDTQTLGYRFTMQDVKIRTDLS